MSDDDGFRQRAPGRATDHPDWLISHSGGVDSTAAALVAIDALRSSDAGGNFAKTPVGIYLDTRTGAPLNRLYVEQFFDWLGIQLWTLRTDEKFEAWLRRDGAPGSGAHQEVRNELKDRQVSKLTTMADDPIYVLGIAADESDTRAEFPKVREMRRHTEVYPVHRLSRKERVEIVLRSGCPINPLWLHPDAIADCGCLCNGDPSELDTTAELFPQFAQRLQEWEEAISHDFPHDTLGWSGLSADEQAARRDGYQQDTLPMCDVDGCSRARDPAEVRAFKTAASGATVEESVSILYGRDRPTDGGGHAE
jgi:3'-phosphoadenosine 5'-phosphosulfate sulfotransferase (PAPS reductase)/FAD synthetase